MKIDYEDWDKCGIPEDIDLYHPINKKIAEDLDQIQKKYDGVKRINIAVAKSRSKQDKIASIEVDKDEELDIYETENLILKIITHYSETLSQSFRFRIHLYPWKYGISPKVSQTDIKIKSDNDLDEEYAQEFTEGELNQLKIALVEKSNMHKQLMEVHGLLASVFTGMKEMAQSSQEKYLQLADKNVELGRLSLQRTIFEKEQETEEKIALMKEETRRKRNEGFTKVVGNITKNPQVMGIIMKKVTSLIPGKETEQQQRPQRQPAQKTEREIWIENNPLTYFSKNLLKKHEKDFDSISLNENQKNKINEISESKSDEITRKLILELSNIDGVCNLLNIELSSEEIKILELYINEIGPRTIYSKLLKDSIDGEQWNEINYLFSEEEKDQFVKTLESKSDNEFESNFDNFTTEETFDKLFKLKNMMNDGQMNILNKMLGLE